MKPIVKFTMKFKKNPFLYITAVLLVLCLFLPSGNVVLMPGSGFDAFKFINSKHSKSRKGSLNFLTVNAFGMGRDLNNFLPVFFYFDKSARVLPSQALIDDNSTSIETNKKNKAEFSNSENTAITATKKYLKLKSLKNINFKKEDIGGPSAGLIITIALIYDVSNMEFPNLSIAGTGTISPNGQVGEIGGVRQKAITAAKNGANVLFIPNNNCLALQNGWIPNGLTVYKVKTIDDAIKILQFFNNKQIDSSNSEIFQSIQNSESIEKFKCV
jgi:PDZ domain-containing protein